jgi:hypothetical protein
MLHYQKLGGVDSLVMRLHREHKERRARMLRPLTPPAAPAAVAAPTPVRAPLPAPALHQVYPAHVFTSDAGGEAPKKLAMVRNIQDVVCKITEVRWADLLSSRRERSSVVARMVAMYLCTRHTPNSFPDLGRRFGGRYHTTVLSAVKRVKAIMAAPDGTGISPQYQADACDVVRNFVRRAELVIDTWDDRTARLRCPSRSGQ